MTNRFPTILTFLAFGLAPAPLARAGAPRDALAGESLDQTRNNPSYYQLMPITHVIPAFNTITYALELDYKDVTVTPKDPAPRDAQAASEALKLGGYTVAPYLAVSLRYLGLGFSAEDGRRTARYADQQFSQASQADYTALGAFLYLIPFPQAAVAPSLVFGAKNYTVSHVVGPEVRETGGGQPPDGHTYRYSLTGYEAGFDVPIRLLQRFMLIPWVDGTWYDTRQAQALAKDDDYQQDLQLFWHSDPRVRYGVDFAVKIDRFEVHLGSLFGAIVHYGDSVSYISDKSLSLSLSVDQKGG